jgi:hypothetical protein
MHGTKTKAATRATINVMDKKTLPFIGHLLGPPVVLFVGMSHFPFNRAVGVLRTFYESINDG